MFLDVFIFLLERKKKGRVGGRHNYWKKPPPRASGFQSINKLTRETTNRRILKKGYLTLSWTVMQLAASFWRISVTPLESLSYFSLGSSSLSSSCTKSRENDSHHGFIWNNQTQNTFLKGNPEMASSMIVNNYNYSSRVRSSCFIFPTGRISCYNFTSRTYSKAENRSIRTYCRQYSTLAY